MIPPRQKFTVLRQRLIIKSVIGIQRTKEKKFNMAESLRGS
jgi:hypothetical protein